MANVRSGNTFYIDTEYSASTDELAIKNIRIRYITVTATSASAVLLLSDSSTDSEKVDLRVATSGSTELFDFSDSPLVFPNGIKPTTLTNAVATCVIEESRG